jgi:hypothetical protein
MALAGTAGRVVAFDGRRHAGLHFPRKQAPWHAGPRQAVGRQPGPGESIALAAGQGQARACDGMSWRWPVARMDGRRTGA